VTGERCALCGLPIVRAPVVRVVDGVERHFDAEGCARAYTLASQNGVLDQVTHDPATAQAPASDHEQAAQFTIHGLSCPGCAVAAERMLRSYPGINDAQVSFASQQGRFSFDPSRVSPAAALAALDKLGYRAQLSGEHTGAPAGGEAGAEHQRPHAMPDGGGHAMPDHGGTHAAAAMHEHGAERSEESIQLQLIAAIAFGMQVMLLYLVQLYPLYGEGQFNDPSVRRLQYLVWLLATPVLFYGGLPFLRAAWLMLVHAHTANMDTLVALGTLSAYGYSVYVTITGNGQVYFDSVAMITTFIMVGRYLEAIGGSQARKDIRRMLTLQPAHAWLKTADGWLQVMAADLTPGEQILVKPGERVPADLEVTEGSAAVDESLVTGESRPVERAVGDRLLSGAVVTDGALVGRVLHPPAGSRLAQITALVQRTLAAKPPIQRLADRASAYFTYGILSVALLTAAARLLIGQPTSAAVLAAVSVLVVACPCALGLATPLALAVVLGRATRAGALVRNQAALETGVTVRRIVFDKTGTLTRGSLTVVAAVDASGQQSGDGVLCRAAAVEQFSEHPVARAIVSACHSPLAAVEGFRALRGLGVTGRLAGAAEPLLVGSRRLVTADVRPEIERAAEEHARRGETVVWVGSADGVEGYIALDDEPSPSAAAALAQLREAGVRPVMLSGDTAAATAAMAARLGLADYLGDCPPAAKAQRIREWQQQGEKVAMVGDGVNDAPALAQADLSITVAGGTDIAGETSDLVLSRPELTIVPEFIALSRRTRRIIRENLGWAFAYNLVAVPLAVLGIISPVYAAIAMACSSLLVVGNSLRLR
jgi:heavy metal translocating P-type ATPase